nr:hypothetical protein [uncultured Roseateles sp.]
MTDTQRTAQELAAELERKIGEYEVTCCIAGMHERAPMTLEMERSTIKALVRRLAALALQAEPVACTDEQRDSVRRQIMSRMNQLIPEWVGDWRGWPGTYAFAEAALIALADVSTTPAPAQAEQSARAMFVARLKRGDELMTGDDVLALLNDCDMLAAREAQAEPTMADAIAAGDGTLHGAIDYWQQRAEVERLQGELRAYDESPAACHFASRLESAEQRADTAEARLERARGLLQDMADLYDTDEGCKSLPQYVAARAFLNEKP